MADAAKHPACFLSAFGSFCFSCLSCSRSCFASTWEQESGDNLTPLDSPSPSPSSGNRNRSG